MLKRVKFVFRLYKSFQKYLKHPLTELERTIKHLASYSFEGYFLKGHTCNGVREFKYLGYFIKNNDENVHRFEDRERERGDRKT